MSKRFGKKQKRALKANLELQDISFKQKEARLQRKNNLLENSLRCLERDFYELKGQIRDFLPKPRVSVEKYTELQTSERFIVIDLSTISLKIIEPNLNDRSIEFISNEFAEVAKHAFMKELIKFKRS